MSMTPMATPSPNTPMADILLEERDTPLEAGMRNLNTTLRPNIPSKGTTRSTAAMRIPPTTGSRTPNPPRCAPHPPPPYHLLQPLYLHHRQHKHTYRPRWWCTKKTPASSSPRRCRRCIAPNGLRLRAPVGREGTGEPSRSWCQQLSS